MDVGRRIKYWRRRRNGMSQRALAGLAGVSQPYISQVESGLQSIDRRSTLAAIAEALQVTVADLLGQPGDPTDPVKAKAAAYVPAIRVALAEIEADDVPAPTRSRDDVAAGMLINDAHRLICDFASAAPMMPGLLRNSYAYGPALLAEVTHAVASLLRSIGYRDLAKTAADLSVTAATESGDFTLISATQFMRIMCLPQEASGVVAGQARRVYEELQPYGSDPAARRGYGTMHLAAALAEASRNRVDTIEDHLREALEAALTVGEPVKPGGLSMSFGPTNVGMWSVATALELGEYRRAVEIAQTVHPEALEHANRQAHYWLDYGRALSYLPGKEHEAIAKFAKAADTAPQYVRVLPVAQNAVAAMIARARRKALAEDLRRLADRMGLHID